MRSFSVALLAAGVLIGTAAAAQADEPAHDSSDVSRRNVRQGERESGQTLRWRVDVLPAHAKQGDEIEIVFTADIASGWILYSSDFSVEIGPRPAKFVFDANPALSFAGPVRAVGSRRKKDPALGVEYTYFASRAEFRQKARLVAPLKTVSGRIDAQTCFQESGLCELFRERFSAGL